MIGESTCSQRDDQIKDLECLEMPEFSEKVNKSIFHVPISCGRCSVIGPIDCFDQITYQIFETKTCNDIVAKPKPAV